MRSNRVLILGANGSQGRRYTAIVRYLGMIPVCVDVDNQVLLDSPHTIDAGHAIIATPIDRHEAGIRYCCDHQIPFICEKPIAKDSRKVEELARLCSEYRTPGFMVNNWRYAHIGGAMEPGRCMIYQNYYNHGRDGVWDLLQPLYYSAWPNVKGCFVIEDTSPIFTCLIDGIVATTDDFGKSYVLMLIDFFGARKGLVTIADSYYAHRKVEEYIKENPDAK